MKKTLNRAIGGVVITLFMLLSATAQAGVEFSSSLNPVGSGARATGMGGAFIGIADDATAASWNPAGLINLEKPEFSFVFSSFSRDQEFHSSVRPELDGMGGSISTIGLNYASIAYPFVLFNRNMVVSMNYQRLYDMDKDYSFVLDNPGDPHVTSRSDVTQDGFLYTFSPAMAVQVIPGLYVGATLNLWGSFINDNGWTTRTSTRITTDYNPDIRFEDMLSSREEINMRGTNAHFGVLWNVYGPWTVGAVYKTAFDARLRQNLSFKSSQDIYEPSSATDPFIHIDFPPVMTSEKMIMKMPDSYGIGVSYRHSDAWTIALDIYRTNWSRFVIRDAKGNEYNPISTAPISEGRLHDTTQVRLGTEYLFIKEKFVIPVRFGAFYDPEPQTGRVDDYYGFSVGTGYAGGRIAFDISYQYRFANDIRGDLGAIIPGTKMDAKQHTVNASVVFYFE